MSEHRSRINGCNTTRGWDLDYYRWVDRMETSFLNKQLWRKSSQVGRGRGLPRGAGCASRDAGYIGRGLPSSCCPSLAFQGHGARLVRVQATAQAAGLRSTPCM